MDVSLEQAIEIYAKSLSRRAGRDAPQLARDKARRCAAIGDRQGHEVWSKVASIAEALLKAKAAAQT
jgi:hypothetical protein